MERLRQISTLPALFLSMLFSQNLAPNPSFEVYTACPSSWGQLTNCTPWINGAGTCDFMHSCATTASYSTPSNNFGNQIPSTGSGYIGMVTMTNFGWYEHAGVPLTSALVPGTTYNVSMKVSLADIYPQYSCDKIGFLFTNSGADPGIPGTAHVYTTSVVSSNTTWTTISGTFTPAIAYSHVFIGSFFPWASMVNVSTGYGSYPSGYYYFDDIVVTPTGPLDSRNIHLTINDHQFSADLSWEPEGVENIARYEVEQGLDLDHFVSAGTFESNIKSTQLTPLAYNTPILYRVRAIDNQGNTFTSAISSITINRPEEIYLEVFPNPVGSSEAFNVRLISGEMTDYMLSVFSLDGKLIREYSGNTAIGELNLTIPTQGMAPGSYFLRMQSGNETLSRTITVN